MNIIHTSNKWWLVNGEEMTPLDPTKNYEVKKQSTPRRTTRQNSAMHLYFNLVSDQLNDNGISMNAFMIRKRDIKTESVFRKIENKIISIFLWLTDKFSFVPKFGVIVKKIQAKLLDYVLECKKELVEPDSVEIPWTPKLVKDVIWRNIQVAVVDKESTTKLNNEEVTKVYEAVNYYLVDRFKLESIEFPCKDSLIFEQNYKEMTDEEVPTNII